MTLADPGRYRSWIFDCDGVLLDSNRIKTEGFRAVAGRHHGPEAAEALVAWHLQNGGVSRWRKFEHLFDEILQRPAAPGEVDALAAEYGEWVVGQLLTCDVAEGLEALRAATPGARWLVVSGGAQSELRTVFAARGLDRLFDGGIFGSPDAKHAIVAREAAAGNVPAPAVFLGDSRLDHEVAAAAGCDFVFVSGWSEFRDWPGYCARHGLPVVPALSGLLEAGR